MERKKRNEVSVMSRGSAQGTKRCISRKVVARPFHFLYFGPLTTRKREFTGNHFKILLGMREVTPSERLSARRCCNKYLLKLVASDFEPVKSSLFNHSFTSLHLYIGFFHSREREIEKRNKCQARYSRGTSV